MPGLYRDALGCVPPAGLPEAFIGATEAPMEQLLRRYARTHGPFTTAEPAHRFGLRAAQLEPVLRLLESQGTLIRGEIRPSGTGPEWCDAEVMRQLRRRTLARARDQVAPVDGATLGRFLPAWHGIGEGRKGPERLLEALIQLEGLSVSWRQLDRVLLPARVPGYRSEDLDLLAASGQIIWVGRGAVGPKDGRVALYRPEHAALALEGVESAPIASQQPELRAQTPADRYALGLATGDSGSSASVQVNAASAERLQLQESSLASGDRSASGIGDASDVEPTEQIHESADQPPPADPAAVIVELILSHLSRRGACFLFELQQVVERAKAMRPVLAVGAGTTSDQERFETALWDLVWAGLITNDTFAPLRALGARRSASAPRPRRRARFGAGAGGGVGGAGFGRGLAGGRWSLVRDLAGLGDLDDWPAEMEVPESVAGRQAVGLVTDGSATASARNTEQLLMRARIMLERYGVLSREAVAAEHLAGGFSPLYRVLKQMEEVGQVRRGYFVEGLSGAQFALPAAIDRLRAARLDELPIDGFGEADVRIIAATDPANPYGALLPWPSLARVDASDAKMPQGSQRNAGTSVPQSPKRIAGAWLILIAGKPIVYVAASGKQILTFPDVVSDDGNELELALAALPRVPAAGRKRLLIQHIDGLPAMESPLREALLAAGFEADYDALVPVPYSSAARRGGTARDPNAISCADARS